MSAVLDAMAGLGPKLAAHILLVAAAIALGVAIALPLAVWASRNRTVGRISLALASLVQTIPALALLALFFPILLSLRAVLGDGLPTLGFLPAFLALSLYALLPILRNAVTAREQMAGGVLEAADGVGMTAAQKLWLVEAPLAAPYIMAGIRTATVWTIGMATLATTIGQPSLGDPIFAGLQTQNWTLVLAGCFASAALALVADGLLALVERGLAWGRSEGAGGRVFGRVRGRWLVALGGAAALAGVIAAAITLYAPLGGDGAGRETVTVGAKNFSEQYILARLIGRRLGRAGYRVEYREGLGSSVMQKALETGAIDVAVDYTGTLWSNEMHRTGNPGREAMYRAVAQWEAQEAGVRALGRLGFENAYALAMPRARARQSGVTSVADLARVAPRLTLGGDVEWFERPEWAAVRDAYGLRFGKTRNFSPTFLYNALRSGEADVITAFSSDGRVAADDLLVLADPKDALPSYDAVLLVAPTHARDQRLIDALTPLVGAIDVTAMRRANLSVDREDGAKRTPARAAEALDRKIAGAD